MNLDEAITVLEATCVNPSSGLPEAVFLLLTRLTPMVNVDLLIQNDAGHTLLTWREDIYHGNGWHIPGGIIRLKETAADRITAVARLELGCQLTHEGSPMAIKEFIAKHQLNRGHCVSLLYRCRLMTPPSEKLEYPGGSPQPGMYAYFDRVPDDLLGVHNMYRDFIGIQSG